MYKNIINFWDKYLFVIIALIGYFEISFFLFPLKFGAIYFHYPWRYEIVENIRHGFMPFWYYTQHMGIPIHADPQSGAWYPVVWVFSLFGKYSLYHFHMEFMLHIIIAGLGMQYLSRMLKISKFSGFIISIAYIFSGIFADNVLTSWTISMAWLPLIIASFIALIENNQIKNILSFSLSLTMLITGGYPAFTISLFYILFFYLLITFIKEFKINKRKAFILLKGNIFALVLTILMSLILLVSVFISSDFISRTHAISIQYASEGILNIKSFITLLIPFSSVNSFGAVIPELKSTFTMSNSYFGILPLILVISSFFILRTKEVKFLFLLGLLFILYSLGNQYFIYQIFYYILPGFNLFRYPNFVRVFFIIAFLLISGMSLDKIMETKNIKIIINLVTFFILLFIIIIIYELATGGLIFNYSSFSDFFKNISFSNRILIQSIIQVLLLSFFLLIIKRKIVEFKTAILVIIIADMIFSFQLNYIYTGYAPRISLSEANSIINKNDPSITFEKNTNILKNHVKNGEYLFDFGLNDYSGKIDYFGNTSFKIINFGELMDKYPNHFKNILTNSVIYFSNDILSARDLDKKNIPYSKKTLYLKQKDYNLYNSYLTNEHVQSNLIFTKFSPEAISCKFENVNNGFITLLQNYYYGWKVFVDDKEKPIVISNLTFMSVFVKKGSHKISFKYDNILVREAFYISLFSFFSVLLLWMYLVIVRRNK